MRRLRLRLLLVLNLIRLLLFFYYCLRRAFPPPPPFVVVVAATSCPCNLAAATASTQCNATSLVGIASTSTALLLTLGAFAPSRPEPASFLFFSLLPAAANRRLKNPLRHAAATRDAAEYAGVNSDSTPSRLLRNPSSSRDVRLGAYRAVINTSAPATLTSRFWVELKGVRWS